MAHKSIIEMVRDDERRQRRREAIRLHEIEGNPFTPEDEEMFAMFDREEFTDAERRAYIIEEAKRRRSIVDAAE